MVVVLSAGARPKNAESVQREIKLLSRAPAPLPMIFLSDTEEPKQILDTLEQGARGYIPTSTSLRLAIEAIRLVRAGGTYAPADILRAGLKNESGGRRKPSGNGILTARQSAVLQAVRKGKANKIIAYELDMRESTVKVHVRNLMRKLMATNRTELAYLARDLLDDGESS